MSVEQWNKLVDGFDAEGIAKQLQSVGAGYYQISIGQNSGYYLSSNATYDRQVGIKPSKCSRRDLVASLYEALNKRGIKLLVYLPSGAPARDQAAVTSLEWRNGPYPNREFQARWEQVIHEWSQPARSISELPGRNLGNGLSSFLRRAGRQLEPQSRGVWRRHHLGRARGIERDNIAAVPRSVSRRRQGAWRQTTMISPPSRRQFLTTAAAAACGQAADSPRRPVRRTYGTMLNGAAASGSTGITP
jgi:hypothetical protein